MNSWDVETPEVKSETACRLSSTVNGQSVDVELECNTLLIDFLRDDLGALSVKRSCEVQMCGSCTVLVEGLPTSSCCYLAVDTNMKSVQTVEGLRALGQPDPTYQALEDAFFDHAAVQCGFCTPGFMVTLWSLIQERQLTSETTEEELRFLLKGNLCRCTGYEPILRAARAAVAAVAGQQ